MAVIKRLKEKEIIGGASNVDVYPITHSKAIYDTKNRILQTLIEIYDKNVSDTSKLAESQNKLKSEFETLLGTNDVTNVIDTFQEIKDFLQNYTNSDNLVSVLEGFITPIKEQQTIDKEELNNKIDEFVNITFKESYNTLDTKINTTKEALDLVENTLTEEVECLKNSQLIAGDNITISSDYVISAVDTKYKLATAERDGLMSAYDKYKLDTISEGAGSGENTPTIDTATLDKRYLGKYTDDRSEYTIASNKGFEVGEFEPNIQGAVFNVVDDGITYLELDKLKVRMKAYFETLEIQNINSVGGIMILSPAGAIKVSAVEELENGYKCYFLAEQDGERIENRFHVGDLAYSKNFNSIKRPGIYNQVYSNFYWRLVTEIGENFIVLDKIDCQTDSDAPEVGDVIAQRGSRATLTASNGQIYVDTDRQCFMEFCATGVYAPTITLYQGVDDYTLLDKAVIQYGYDAGTKKAFYNVYGDMYIGDKEQASYIKYDNDAKKVTIKGSFDLKSTFELEGEGPKTLQEVLDQYKKEAQEEFLDSEKIKEYDKTFEDLTNRIQEQEDGAFTMWFGTVEPTLDNYPANEWIDDETRNIHIDDLYYSDDGKAYRFVFDRNTNEYKWIEVQDVDIKEALEAASAAQDTADAKRKIFVSQPTNNDEYDIGDLWLNATAYNSDGSILMIDELDESNIPTGKKIPLYKNETVRAATKKEITERFSYHHWVKASKYTDDTVALNAQKEVGELNTAVNIFQSNVNNINEYISDTFKDGILDTSEKRKLRTLLDEIKASKQSLIKEYLDVEGNSLFKEGGKVTDGKGNEVDNYYNCKEHTDLKIGFENLLGIIVYIVETIDGVETNVPVRDEDGNVICTGGAHTELVNLIERFITSEGTTDNVPTIPSIGNIDIIVPDTDLKDTYISTADRNNIDRKLKNFNNCLALFRAAITTAGNFLMDKIGENAINMSLRKIGDFNYIKEAIQNGRIDMEGGLLLGNILAVGDPNGADGIVEVKAGINGVYKGDSSIAAWYGGTMNDRDPSCTGNFTTDEGSKAATSVIRMDGSGYFAKGALWWDTLGNLHCNPASFVINEKDLGDYIKAFHVVKNDGGIGIKRIEPQASFSNLSIIDDITIKGITKNVSFYVNDNGVLTFDGDIAATGNVIAYADGNETTSDLLDKIISHLDPETLGVKDGLLYVKGVKDSLTSVTIQVNNKNYTIDDKGIISLPDYPTTLDWGSIKRIPSWITSSKPVYTIGEIEGLEDSLDDKVNTDTFDSFRDSVDVSIVKLTSTKLDTSIFDTFKTSEFNPLKDRVDDYFTLKTYSDGTIYLETKYPFASQKDIISHAVSSIDFSSAWQNFPVDGNTLYWDTDSKTFKANESGLKKVTVVVNGNSYNSSNGVITLPAYPSIENKADKATTLLGYGITDAKIVDGVIMLGENSITPLTQHQDISGKADKATTLKGYGITDAYTKTEVDTAVDKKANKATTLAGYGITDGVNSVTVSGSGNVVTTASISGHSMTLTKGSTMATKSEFDTFVSKFNDLFEVVGTGDSAYIKAKKSFVSVGEIAAWQGDDYETPSVWKGTLPIDSSTMEWKLIDNVWSLSSKGTVDAITNLSIKIGEDDTQYTINNGVINIPAYPSKVSQLTDSSNYALKEDIPSLQDYITKNVLSSTIEPIQEQLFILSNRNQFDELIVTTGNFTTVDATTLKGSLNWSYIKNSPTTLKGYGITDAKILNGVITLGATTITPLTQHQDISGKADKATTLAGYGITNAYSKTEVDNKLTPKLDVSTFNTFKENEFTPLSNKLADYFTLKTHTNGTVYLETKYPFASQKDIISYAVSSLDFSNVWRELPVDGTTIYWDAATNSFKANESGLKSFSIILDGKTYNSTDGAVILPNYPKRINWENVDNIPSNIVYTDSNGFIPSSVLPSYVDDVLEYSAKSDFPARGETGKIYVDTTTNLTYRWGGSSYIEISQSLALGETSSTAYAGDKGKALASYIATINKTVGTSTEPIYFKNGVPTKANLAELSIQLNSGTATKYNGSVTKSINITPTAIGTYTSGTLDSKFNTKANVATTLFGYNIHDGINSISVFGTGNAITDAYIEVNNNTNTAHSLALIKATTFVPKETFDDYFKKIDLGNGNYAIKTKYHFLSEGEIAAYQSDGTISTDVFLNIPIDNDTIIWKDKVVGGVTKKVLAATGTQGALTNVSIKLGTSSTAYKTNSDGIITIPDYYSKDDSNSKFVNGLSTSGNYLVWSKNGTANNITVPYSTNAGKLSGVSLNNSDDKKPFGKIPIIKDDGVIEIGRCIDFHFDNTTGSDFSTRLCIKGDNSNLVTLPAVGGTLALTSDNVASATKLENSRKLWGNSFNGSADVNGTLTFAKHSDNRYLEITNNGSYKFHVPTNNSWSYSSYVVKSDGSSINDYVWGSFGSNDSLTYHYYGGTWDNPNMVILPSGSIGIGTSGPSTKLEIAGCAKASTAATADRWFMATNRNGAISLLASTNRGLYDSTTTKWLCGTNGTNTFLMQGSVGIGTTTPGYKLDVLGSIGTNNQLISTVATGTAPLAVSSSTVVTNLNADLLDGLHSTDFRYGTLVKSGKMLYKDPYFKSGNNGCGVYNNLANSMVVIERIARTSSNPFTNTDYELRIKNTGTSSPGCGGFCFANGSRANAIFIYRIVANIPSGRKLLWAANTSGVGSLARWLTPNDGTGRYTEYILRIQCGSTSSSTSTFSTIGYFYIDGSYGSSSTPLYWYVAYATCYDVTNDESSVLLSDCSTKLQTARMIWGHPFNGTGNVEGNLALKNNAIFDVSYLFFNNKFYQVDDVERWTLCTHNEHTWTKTLMAVTSNGNVGIGESSPEAKLVVKGDIRCDNALRDLNGNWIVGKSDSTDTGIVSIGSSALLQEVKVRNSAGSLTVGADGNITASACFIAARMFVNTGDSTLKIYDGRITSSKSDGNICLQTSIDGTDGQTHAHPTNHGARCNLVLQPRGGQVYIGSNPDGGNTSYKLNVNGAVNAATYYGASDALNQLFEKVNIGTTAAPVYAIKAKYHFYSVGEIAAWHTDTLSAPQSWKGTLPIDSSTMEWKEINGIWSLSSKGTVGAITSLAIKIGTNATQYTPSNGVITLPAYPIVPTKVSQLSDATDYLKSATAESTYFKLSGGTLSGAVFSGSNYMPIPKNGLYTTTASSVTGAITISLPSGIDNTMVSMWADVYNYSTNTSFSVHICGYTYSNSTFQHSPSAVVYGANHKVRYGYSNGFKIYIGETNSTWAYPQVVIRDVLIGFYGTRNVNWKNDVTISFSTSIPSIQYDASAYAITTRNISSQSVSYASSADSATNATYLSNAYSTRPTSANVSFGDGKLRAFKATSSMSTGKPKYDAHILHFAWDATNGFDAQLALFASSASIGMQIRAQESGTWRDWVDVITAQNIGSQRVNYAETAGTASANDVYSWAKASTKPSYSFNELTDGLTLKTLSTVSHSGFTSSTVDDKIIPTMTFISRWNGTYNNTNSSNLAYCNQGKFGSIITKSSTDYLVSTTKYAASSSVGGAASNSSLLEGTSKAGLFTAFTTNGNNTRITIGGTTKDLTVPYASNAGKVNNSLTINGVVYNGSASKELDTTRTTLDGYGIVDGISTISVVGNGNAITDARIIVNNNNSTAHNLTLIKDATFAYKYSPEVIHNIIISADTSTEDPYILLHKPGVNWSRFQLDSNGVIHAYTSKTGTALATINAVFSGNASSATVLSTSRTLWGQSFNGSANVTGSLSSVSDITMSGKVYQANAQTMLAKNSAGTYETWVWPRWSDNVMYINYGSAGFHIRNNSSTTTMFMTSGNKVGIGTTSPSESLSVVGNGLFSNDASTDNKSVIVKNKNGAVSLLTSTNRGLYDSTKSQWICGTNGTNTFLSQGNVGIGKTDPAYKLDVNGDTITRGWIRTTGESGWYSQDYGGGIRCLKDGTVEIYNKKPLSVNSTVKSTGSITTEVDTATELNHRIKNSVANVEMWVGTGGKHGLYSNTKSAAIIAVYENNTYCGVGNLGIGLINPSQKLHVSGNILATGEVTAYSDRRLKSSIETFKNRGFLRPVSYIKDGEKSIGFIAQEVRNLYPEFVLGEETSTEYLALNYSQITAVLESQIIEHDDEITKLKKEIDTLREKIKLLETKKCA